MGNWALVYIFQPTDGTEATLKNYGGGGLRYDHGSLSLHARHGGAYPSGRHFTEMWEGWLKPDGEAHFTQVRIWDDSLATRDTVGAFSAVFNDSLTSFQTEKRPLVSENGDTLGTRYFTGRRIK